MRRIRQKAVLALGFFRYMKEPLTRDSAIDAVKRRIDHRENNFLDLAKTLIYDSAHSPYRKLLLWAGCDYPDLEGSIRVKGLEKTLESLRDAGVFLTLEEFKSKTPICRRGLFIETGEGDFDNPYLMGRSIRGATSGSRSKGTRVLYDWNFFAEEAANEMLLYDVHGVSEIPSAFWLPGPPSISGIHNFLVQLKFRRPPLKWFSHLPGNAESRAAMEYLVWSCRIFGVSPSRPEFTEIKDAERVARWMEGARKENGRCVVKTFASSAVHIVQAALEHGIDISGGLIFTGGEPLTEQRYRYMQSAGVHAVPRYVATETGLIGAGCPNGDSPDAMHIYIDRLALIQRDRAVSNDAQTVPAFLFSTLSCNTGKIMLNAELGDFGRIHIRSCDCLLGQTGMKVHVSEVRSFDKLTGEGMTLVGSVLDEVIGELVEKAGGRPDDYQFWESEDGHGLARLTIAVSPKIQGLDETQFAEKILDKLRQKGAGAQIASQFWRQANTLRVVRAQPEMSKGFKMLPIIQQPGS
ncbi:MAG: hypothetical protein HY203_06170 [Nitrospirae bacterium]|nr:hypothetical protein [Nitrospirota bacterium]